MFSEALAANPRLYLIAVLPRFPDQDGRWSLPPNLIGRTQAIKRLRSRGGERVGVYGIENHDGTPVYVHAKVCVIDDVWASVGSANLNLRSWTHDSELACAILDQGQHDRSNGFAKNLRLMLCREHLDLSADDTSALTDPETTFRTFATSAARLDTWHASGRSGPRPPGRLRSYEPSELPPWTQHWASVLYRWIYDPDGRPLLLRRSNQF